MMFLEIASEKHIIGNLDIHSFEGRKTIMLELVFLTMMMMKNNSIIQLYWIKATRYNCYKLNLFSPDCLQVHVSVCQEKSSTKFIPQKSLTSLVGHCEQSGWQEFVLKPAIGGAARHTYRFKRAEAKNYESIFSELNEHEMWLLQEFQYSITTKGEVTHVLFDGEHSHSLIKHAKHGDFRVQDDFSGTLAHYEASVSEIEFAQNAIRIVDPIPTYGRVDVIWGNTDQMCVSELELIEPELWLRLNDQAPISMAKAIQNRLSRSTWA